MFSIYLIVGVLVFGAIGIAFALYIERKKGRDEEQAKIIAQTRKDDNAGNAARSRVDRLSPGAVDSGLQSWTRK